MTPAAIIREAQREGVNLTLSPVGAIKATGDGAVVNRWLPVIRERKAEIIDVLKAGAGDTANALEVACSPDGPYAEILEQHPDTIAVVEQPKPDPFPCDLCTCSQCANYRQRVCTVARPERGAQVIANRGYRPDPNRLLRCEGYAPLATEPDQRTGAERWPGLLQKDNE